MVLQPDADAVSSAAQACTCVWGGVHFPWLAPDAPDILRTAEALAVDVFYPVAGDSAAREVADQVGYRWKPEPLIAGSSTQQHARTVDAEEAVDLILKIAAKTTAGAVAGARAPSTDCGPCPGPPAYWSPGLRWKSGRHGCLPYPRSTRRPPAAQPEIHRNGLRAILEQLTAVRSDPPVSGVEQAGRR